MLGSVASAAPAGFLAASSANVLDASNRKIGPNVTTVYALRKADVAVRMVEWSPLASSLVDSGGVNDNGGNRITFACAGRDRCGRCLHREDASGRV